MCVQFTAGSLAWDISLPDSLTKLVVLPGVSVYSYTSAPLLNFNVRDCAVCMSTSPCIDFCQSCRPFKPNC